jgi:cyclomaltodextrinase / maltogenic alpha-amylase / neopullulanase
MMTKSTFKTPDWACDAVFYQILPDRFADGARSNDATGAQAERFGGKPSSGKREGGDLSGIIRHLDYLEDLGINALYLNPVFTARSAHGYDPIDYLHIDPHLGTDAQFKKLVDKVHERGWHLILDVAFDHTSVDFFAFKSLIEQGEQSPNKDWYFVNHFPIEVRDGQTSYEAWYGMYPMPRLNVNNPATRDYLLDVATRWLRDAGIDGWRLDAADEVDHRFWKALRKAVKETNPDAYLVGEMWGNATDWLRGDEFDAVMNYRWRAAVLEFFGMDAATPMQFDAELTQIRSDYPPAVTPVMFNMLASHDIERTRTAFGDWRKEGQAVLFQMTYLGAPCVYYGDEIGMEGARDPHNRHAMIWDRAQWDKGSRDFYRRCIALRRDHEVLRRGNYRTVYRDDAAQVFGFVRTQDEDLALVLFNRSDRPQRATVLCSEIGVKPLRDWLGMNPKVEIRPDVLVVDLPERGFAVLGTERRSHNFSR